MDTSEKLNLGLTAALILAIGLIVGYGGGHFRASKANFPEIQTIGEANPGISTIRLIKVENGLIKGEIVGQNARIAYSSEDILELAPQSRFEIPLSAIRLNEYYAASALPSDVQFVASAKGKYYYSVFDRRALNLSESNRIYFRSAKEAENRGYIPPK